MLGARAIAIGRASDRIGIGSSGNGSGSSDARESKGARAAAEGNGGRESVWVVRVLWEEDGWVVLGARALANGIGRASLRQRQRRQRKRQQRSQGSGIISSKGDRGSTSSRAVLAAGGCRHSAAATGSRGSARAAVAASAAAAGSDASVGATFTRLWVLLTLLCSPLLLSLSSCTDHGVDDRPRVFERLEQA